MAIAIDPTLAAFIQSLPKTETHLHFEGALPWELLQQLDPEKFAKPPASWANDFKFSSFEHFEKELLDYAFAWFTSPERYHEAGKVMFAKLVEQNVRYVETSFASGMVEFAGLDPHAIMDAILSAVPKELEVRLFFGIHHNGFGEKMLPVIQDTVNWDKLSGLDLHGVEPTPIDPHTAECWAATHAAGKMNKAHAGEFCGADFVRWAVETLNVSRIEHGVRSVEDPAVVELLKERDVTLDVCPISNIKLDVFDQYTDHSLAQLDQAGVRCTINSDDPVSFGNSLTEDYAVLVQEMGFSLSDLKRFARNGIEVSLLDEGTKQALLTELDAVDVPDETR